MVLGRCLEQMSCRDAGVILNVVLPEWLTSIALTLVLGYVAYGAARKATRMVKQEQETVSSLMNWQPDSQCQTMQPMHASTCMQPSCTSLAYDC